MGYALIWIELVVLGILTAAVLLAGAGRLRLNWTRWLIGALVVIVPVLAVGGIFAARHSVPYFYDYLLSLWSCMLVGIVVLAIVGLRRSAHTGEPTARDWPPGRLALAWALVLGLHMMTVANMDTAVRGALSAATTEAGTIALNTAPPRVPDHQNAALVYLKAFEYLEKLPDLRSLEVTAEDIDVMAASQMDALRASLAQQPLVLHLIRRAASISDCRFDRDYARPSILLLLPEIQSLSRAARYLRLAVQIEVADGDRDSALKDIAALFQMSRHAGSDSLLVSHLVSIAIHRYAVESLQTVLGRLSTSDELDRLQIDDVFSFRVLLQRALLMDEAFVLSSFYLPDVFPDYIPRRLSSPPLGPYTRIFFLAGEVDSYREAMSKLRENLWFPYYQSGRYVENEADWPGTFVKLVIPQYKSAFKATARADAEHTLALSAIAAVKYRAANGGLPSQLGELTPDFTQTPLVDPYDGQPIRLLLRDRELVLYSIGPDRKDDQGEVFNEEKETGDLTFRLPMMIRD
jgi:hypothetical protein